MNRPGALVLVQTMRRLRSAGFSMLELTVVIIIIGVLMVVAISRLLPYLDEAERVAVLTVESQLKSSLVMEAAQRIARGQSASIAELEQINPMELLLEPPATYAGVYAGSGTDLPARHWYFDAVSNRLVYKTGKPYAPSVRDHTFDNPQFAVRVIFEDRDADGIFSAQNDELYGIRLLRVAGADWLSGGSNF
ncbi:MAG: type II secretion system protein [Woeseia sp.]